MSSHYVYIWNVLIRPYTRVGDIEKRVQEHNNGKYGAKYTKSRQPVKLVYVEKCADISEVLKREAQIKKLSRGEKLQLIYSRRFG